MFKLFKIANLSYMLNIFVIIKILFNFYIFLI